MGRHGRWTCRQHSTGRNSCNGTTNGCEKTGMTTGRGFLSVLRSCSDYRCAAAYRARSRRRFRAILRRRCLTATVSIQVRLEKDMLDNAYVERTRQVLSAIRRGTHTSDAMAMQWMRAAQGASTFLQVCQGSHARKSVSPMPVTCRRRACLSMQPISCRDARAAGYHTVPRRASGATGRVR